MAINNPWKGILSQVDTIVKRYHLKPGIHELDRAANRRMLATLEDAISKRRLGFGVARSSLTQMQAVN